jgi:transcriptional regulator with XRE-family HTH domain
MEKSTFSPLYEPVRRKLVDMRERAGFTQRDLAAKLNRERSFVSRLELGERRLDLVEFYWLTMACGQDPAQIAAELMNELAGVEGREKRGGKARRKPRTTP